MSQLNRAVRSTPIFTAEGAKATKISPLHQLIRSTMACMLWEDNFYEEGGKIADRIKELVHAVKLEEAAFVAITAREQMKLRHVPLLVVREMARHPALKHSPGIVSDTLARVIQRADELTEFMAIYWQDGKQPLSKQVKLGLAKAFQKFNEYELAKYNRDKSIRLRDVLFLCHSKPADLEAGEAQWDKAARAKYARTKQFSRGFSDGELLYGRLVYDKLETPDTWEVELSAGADKRETFMRLMAERKLGDLAFLRNLRNMMEAGVPIGDIVASGEQRRWGRVLPFRFIAAARVVPALEPHLEAWMMKCLAGAEKLPGATLLLLDVSVSMGNRLSSKSDLTRLDAAKALAILLREICENVRVFTYNSDIAEVAPRRGFALADAIGKPRGGTDTGKAVAMMNAIPHDRLIVLTDEQSHTSVPAPKAEAGYMINVATERNGIGYGPWVHIDGFSEAIVDYIQESERSLQD